MSKPIPDFDDMTDLDKIKDKLPKIILKGKEEIKKFMEEIEKHFQELYKEIKDNGGLGKCLKAFFDITELEMEILTFSELVKNAKSKKPNESKRCCLVVLDKEMVLPEFAKYSEHYYMCFLNEQNDVVSQGQVYFHCNSLDDKLKGLFGNKEMIILQ